MSERADILIVEDEPVVREGAAKALRHEGWSTDAVWEPDQALSRITDGHYRVILCDLMLPGISGLDLLRRGRDARPSTPFVMITGYATLDRTLDSFRHGAFDFIPKPFDTAELVGVVDRACRFSPDSDDRRPPDASSPVRSDSSAGRYRLGNHTWVRLEEDGAASIGLGSTFEGTLTEVDGVELPETGEHALQTKRLAKLSCGDRAVHRVWAPLSGSIIAVNEELLRNPELFAREDSIASWLVRIVPSRADLELPLLIRD